MRALQLLADRGGATVSSRAAWPVLYGFSSHSRVRPHSSACAAAASSTCATDAWYIVDPLFDEWLRRASPLADRPPIEAPDED